MPGMVINGALTLYYVNAQFVCPHAQHRGSGYGSHGIHYLSNPLLSIFSRKKCTRTDDEEQPIGLVRVFYFWKESGIKAERQCDLRRLVKVCLQNMPASRQLRLAWCVAESTYLLKIRKLSRTWRSCLLSTVRRIRSYSSWSESGRSV